MMAAASLAFVVPLLPITDTYGHFLERLRDQVVRIVRRGRAVPEIVIEPRAVYHRQIWFSPFSASPFEHFHPT
jgi:hypothetical protein